MELVQHYAALNHPTQPVCSVCIANYNGVGLLDNCLQSVFDQQCDFSFEVIVHDDASTDESLAQLRSRYPQVEVLASQENVGFCISNNRMADHARGEYLLLLNNDAALLPGALATLLAYARTHPETGILTLPQFDWITGALVDRGCLLDLFYNPVPNQDPDREEVAMVIGACLWIQRAHWQKFGGFPDWLESIAEDMYLCCFARLHGLRVQALSNSGYRHRQGASFGGGRAQVQRLDSTFRRRRLSERNKTFVLLLFSPSATAWLLLALHLPALVIEGLVLALVRGRLSILTGIYGNAVIALVRSLNQMLARRRTIQAGRTAGVRAYFSVFTWLPRKLAMLKRYGLPNIR